MNYQFARIRNVELSELFLGPPDNSLLPKSVLKIFFGSKVSESDREINLKGFSYFISLKVFHPFLCLHYC